MYGRLGRDVPVFAQIGTDGSHTNQATNSSKSNAIRRDQGGILRIIVFYYQLFYKKLFKIFSKVLCDIFPARFRRFYRKIALLFSSKNDKNLARKPVSNVLRKNFKQLLKFSRIPGNRKRCRTLSISVCGRCIRSARGVSANGGHRRAGLRENRR